MAGPRDWTQNESVSWSSRDERALRRWSEEQGAGRSVGASTSFRTGRTGARPWGAALLSVGVGAAAVYVSLSPVLGSGRSGGHGYVLTTIGLTAIFFGVAAIRRNHIVRSIGITAAAGLGIGLGAIASIAMFAVMATAQTGAGGAALSPVALSNGAVTPTEVELTSLHIVGRGAERTAVVGNGGSVRLAAGYTVRSMDSNPTVDVHLERRVGAGDWTSTGISASRGADAPLTAVTPPYASSGATETVQYRFASRTSASAQIDVVYENQRAYVGMAATVYRYAAPYCPATAVHIADLGGEEAGDYGSGALLIRVDSRVGSTVNLSPSSQRSLALHECSHELQWLNYGGTEQGRQQMEAAAATYFTDGSNGAAPLEHAADCGAQALEPNGYLGYGGYCTPTELAEGQKLLAGQRY